MATFAAYQNILPDPNNAIGSAGQPTGTTGPGFRSIKITSDQPIVSTQTNSGRYLSRALATQKFMIDITYNPMTRDQFEPVYNFLLQKQGGLFPFFVQLPQHLNTRNSAFGAYSSANAASPKVTAAAEVTAGKNNFLVNLADWSLASNGSPGPGDLFTVISSNSNHTKVYQVVRVENASDRLDSSSVATPSSSQLRLHTVPALQRTLEIGAKIQFFLPAVKVIVKNKNTYDLGVDGLYKFSLKLEEVQ